jgi:2-phospho-L-lactate guanylyltransferase
LAVHAVIPLKDPSRGKARLGAVLDAAQRTRLIEIMLGRVVDALVGVPDISRVSVLTGPRTSLPAGCGHLPDQGLELNAAVAHAVRELRTRGEVGCVLVIHADLPFVTSADIRALIEAGRGGSLAAAPDWIGTGTNALAFPLARPIEPRYGPGSLAAHREAARAAELRWRIVDRPGLAEDIDEPAQLKGLAERGGREYAFVSTVLRSRV